jgi:hypothetical protein
MNHPVAVLADEHQICKSRGTNTSNMKGSDTVAFDVSITVSSPP